jgi:hypothetical protein
MPMGGGVSPKGVLVFEIGRLYRVAPDVPKFGKGISEYGEAVSRNNTSGCVFSLLNMLDQARGIIQILIQITQRPCSVH